LWPQTKNVIITKIIIISSITIIQEVFHIPLNNINNFIFLILYAISRIPRAKIIVIIKIVWDVESC